MILALWKGRFIMNKQSPVYGVRAIPIDRVHANNYNPNKMDQEAMDLLYTSISHDGYTQPVVVSEDGDGTYTVIDGFHRYLVMKKHHDIYEREDGKLPCVILDESKSDRMASTIRHNRAKGTHSPQLMSNIVRDLVDAGMSDQWIKKNLGMGPNELLRMKQVSGLARLFQNKEFSKSWN